MLSTPSSVIASSMAWSNLCADSIQMETISHCLFIFFSPSSQGHRHQIPQQTGFQDYSTLLQVLLPRAITPAYCAGREKILLLDYFVVFQLPAQAGVDAAPPGTQG